jgi:hypothetical protein
MTAKDVKGGVNLLRPVEFNFHVNLPENSKFTSLFYDEYFTQVELNNNYSVGLTNKSRLLV